jgi:hypothetical protein
MLLNNNDDDNNNNTNNSSTPDAIRYGIVMYHVSCIIIYIYFFRSRLSSSSVHRDVTFASESAVPAGLQLHLCCLTTTEKLHRLAVVGPVKTLATLCMMYSYIYISGSACSTVGVHSQAWSTSGIGRLGSKSGRG